MWCWHGASENCCSQFSLGFQSPFLYKVKARSCSPTSPGFTVLLSHILQICHFIYELEATINLNSVVCFKQRWFISKFLRGRKGENIWLLLLLTTGYTGIQAASPGQRAFSSFPWEAEYHQYTCTMLLHQFCKGKATVPSSKIIRDHHLHLWVSRGFLAFQLMPQGWVLSSRVSRGCQYARV